MLTMITVKTIACANLYEANLYHNGTKLKPFVVAGVISRLYTMVTKAGFAGATCEAFTKRIPRDYSREGGTGEYIAGGIAFSPFTF